MKKPGNNPIIENDGVCDPHLHVFRGKMYMYTSHDDGPGHSDYTMYDWRIYSTEDFLNWNLEGTFRPEDSYIGPWRKCYACDAAERNGKYYFYFSQDQISTGVAVSDNPGGPFVDALGKALLPQGLVDTACYDPTVFIDDDEAQTPYIIFGYTVFGKSYYIARLNEDMISLAEDPRPIVIENSWQNDATWMTKRDGIYYLNSHGGCYATADNIYGPYTARKPFYQDAYGDHSTFCNFHNQTYCAYGVPENWDSGEKVDPFYRTAKIVYAHFRDNGDMVIDPFICQMGVGQYDTRWGQIQAAWYFSADDGMTKAEAEDGFAVSCQGSGSLAYPHVRNLPENGTLTFRAACQLPQGGKVIVRINGQAAGECAIENTHGEFCNFTCPISCAAGEGNVDLTIEGITLRWFSIQ